MYSIQKIICQLSIKPKLGGVFMKLQMKRKSITLLLLASLFTSFLCSCSQNTETDSEELSSGDIALWIADSLETEEHF